MFDRARPPWGRLSAIACASRLASCARLIGASSCDLERAEREHFIALDAREGSALSGEMKTVEESAPKNSLLFQQSINLAAVRARYEPIGGSDTGAPRRKPVGGKHHMATKKAAKKATKKTAAKKATKKTTKKAAKKSSKK